MQTIPVPADLFDALGAYLVERPYREVAALLGRMQLAAAAAEPVPVAEPAARDNAQTG